jgi:hypothetical protein
MEKLIRNKFVVVGEKYNTDHRIKYVLILLMSLVTSKTHAQANLVLNPSMEEYNFCAILNGVADGAVTNWRNVNIMTGWYMNVCANEFHHPNRETTIPSNAFGYQFPHKGLAFITFFPYTNWNDGESYREYLKGMLRDTLVAGKRYGIQYYISKTESWNYYRFCFSNMGFYFSDTSFFYNNSEVLPLIPQYRNDSLNTLSDTLGWQKVEGSFIASGGEKYFTIGNFDDNGHTKIFDCFGNGADLTAPTGEIAYFIDDVSVIDTSLTDTVQLCMNDSIYLQGAWRKGAGMYYDTVAGMPYRKYINPVSYASTHTLQHYIGKPGVDSFKTAYFWSRIFAGKDTTFRVTMPSVYGCDSVIICRLQDSSTVGISEPNTYRNEASLLIYPNPSTDFINLKIYQFENEKSNELLILVYDITGKQIKVKQEQIASPTRNDFTFKLDISKLSSGMYFVRVVDKKNKYVGSGKFIKSNSF